ncbi:MAG: PEGA domain-containing protein [Ignavibacteriaceae bacterium]|nr:PEGA domain-containing protein [Ignavibacteriaceae bacterium]
MITFIHKIKINFLKTTVSVFLVTLIVLPGCDKEVSRSPVESEAPKGFIYINSTPVGFAIFQNGRNTGRLTPDSISYIEAGDYELTFKKKYFKDTLIVVSLGEDEKINLFVDIASNSSMLGNLFLNTSPSGAEILINDSATGLVTPATFSNLLPGEYSVKFKLSNHRDKEINAIVQSSKTSNYVEALRDTSVWVDYQFFNSGIPTNFLTAVLVDNNNVKWIGSLDKGLIRYDEINFTNYDRTNSAIPANKINCIQADNQNRIWVGTDFGIGILDGSSWFTYNRSNSGLSSEIINSIKFDNAGNVWIGTSADLVKFNGVNWTSYNEPNSLDWINDIYVETESRLWLGTKTGGIFVFEDEIFKSVSKYNYNYPSLTISSIDRDLFNNFWFCFLPDTSGRAGVSYYNMSNFTNYFPGTSQNTFNNIFVDDENNKWIAASEGLIKYDAQNNFSAFTTSNSLITSNIIKASSRDENGIVWITTSVGGLNKYKPPR